MVERIREVDNQRIVNRFSSETNYGKELTSREIARRLIKEGLSRLVPLLDQKTENEFLETIATWVRTLPPDLFSHQWLVEKDNPFFRGFAKKLCKRYGVSLTIIPGKNLRGIYATAPGRIGEIETVMTVPGEAFRDGVLGSDNAFLFAIDGTAAIARGAIPIDKRREIGPRRAFDPRFIDPSGKNVYPRVAPTGDDFDGLIRGLSLEELLLRLKMASPAMQEPGVLKIINSQYRPFTWLDISTPHGHMENLDIYGQRRHPPISLAQISTSEQRCQYGDYSLVSFWVSHNSSPVVQLVLLDSGDIIGLALDAFPETTAYKKLQYTNPERHEVRELTPSIIPIIDHLLQGDAREAMYHGLYLFRTGTWTDQIYFMRSRVLNTCFGRYATPKYHHETIARESKKFALWIAENVFHPAAANPSILGNTKQIAYFGSVLVCRAILPAFDGNSGIAALRFLPAGERGSKNVPIFGWGVSKLLPKLDQLLADPEVKRQFLCKMFQVKPSPEGHGRQALLDFIFEQANKAEPIAAAQYVAQCLTPFGLDDYLDFAQRYLVGIDPRLRVLALEREPQREYRNFKLPRRGSVSFRLLQWFVEHPKPGFTVKDLHDQTGIDERLIRNGLKILANKAFVTERKDPSHMRRIGKLFRIRDVKDSSKEGVETFRWHSPKKGEKDPAATRRRHRLIFSCLAHPQLIENGATLTELHKRTRLRGEDLIFAVKELKDLKILERLRTTDGGPYYRIHQKWAINYISG